jgi:pimeloyl-ACP methyl ester carboxylesterase
METANVPTAFIWGPDDPVSGEHIIAEVERNIPDAPVTRLAGVGHWPMVEDADAVAAAINDQLRKNRS